MKKMEELSLFINFYVNYLKIKKIYLIQNNNDDKIIINVKFTWGLEQEKISLEVLSKDLGLEKTLSNLKQSIKVLNTENKNLKNQNENLANEISNIKRNVNNEINEVKSNAYLLKIEFQKDLLERVYPVGSYYWSSNNISPEELFGGKWTQISGRFLFASDNNRYPIGTEGGEESHVLTISEMPSHSHNFKEFNYQGSIKVKEDYSGQYTCPYIRRDKITPSMSGINNYLGFGGMNFGLNYNKNATGSGWAHNNMPPYITAYCWRRTS